MKQRQLTQEEINLAPEWATRYFIITCTTIRFESEGYYCYSFNGEMSAKERNKFGVDEDSQPIPRKAFNVESFQSPDMHDMDQPYICIDDGIITVDGKIDKHWSIAIAKALGVTASDFIDTKPDNAIIDNNETK